MNAIDLSPSRRTLLQSAGALVVCAAAPADALAQLAGAAIPAGKPRLHPTELDSWVAIDPEGRVTAFFGKMDMGQGVDVAIGQIVADELDVPYSRVTVVMGDSGLTCNQGGASGSTGIQTGGHPLRNAAAEARRLLVEQAAQRLGVTPEQCQVSDGVVSAGDKRVSYAELIGGRYFQHKLDWNNQWGNPLNVTGRAKPKSPDQYKVVGQSIPRNDVPGKVFGTDEFVTDIQVPGMLHGRVIRPQIAGAVPVAVDETSIREIKGARVVRKGDFIGVVAEKEWDAVRAAEQLRITWSNAAPPFPGQTALYEHIRNAPIARRTVEANTGDVDAAFAGAARVVEAEYQWPFQSHASIGPACAIVDARPGEATVWTGSQKPHFVGQGVAKYLGLPEDKVRAIWIMGPGSYGRNDAGDAALDAAVMSQVVGKPVRVQGMRHEGHGWDPKGPASIHRCRAAIDAQGNVVAYEFISKGFSRIDMATNESNPSDTLAGMLVGFPNATQHGFGVPAESYAFASKRTGWETIAPLLTTASPLRTGHLRDPVGPQIHFASESFIDEIAAAIGVDPIEFRLRHVRDARDVEVIKATIEKAGWKPGPAGTRRTTTGDTLTGRGFAYSTRNGTVVAVVCDVEVNRRTGAVWARRFVVGHDCGIIVNPEGLRLCIEGNVVQAVSRALWEEVQFDAKSVTSTDWLSYPILDMTEAPESVECVLINRPAMNPRGAGEPSTRPMAGAVANAIFEATGVRIRRAPFTPDRVKAALA